MSVSLLAAEPQRAVGYTQCCHSCAVSKPQAGEPALQGPNSPRSPGLFPLPSLSVAQEPVCHHPSLYCK